MQLQKRKKRVIDYGLWNQKHASTSDREREGEKQQQQKHSNEKYIFISV